MPADARIGGGMASRSASDVTPSVDEPHHTGETPALPGMPGTQSECGHGVTANSWRFAPDIYSRSSARRNAGAVATRNAAQRNRPVTPVICSTTPRIQLPRPRPRSNPT